MTWQPDYCTAAALKAYRRIDDDVDDTEIADAITAASRAVDDFCHRQFGQVADAEDRVYTAAYDRHTCKVWAEIDDLPTTSMLEITGPSVGDYTLHPVNALAKGMPYTRVVLPQEGEYTITGLWGWSAIPAAVVMATKLQASRFLMRRDAPFGIVGSPDSGTDTKLTATADPDVKVALRRYVRKWWAR